MTNFGNIRVLWNWHFTRAVTNTVFTTLYVANKEKHNIGLPSLSLIKQSLNRNKTLYNLNILEYEIH